MSDRNEQPVPEPDSAKEKVSLYLPVEMVKKLEEIVFHAKQEMPRDKAKQLTKSKIVELVLNIIIYEYDKGNPKRVIKDIVLCWVEQ